MLYTPHLNDRELADYLDHLVSEEEAKRIEKHYLLCPECIHRLRALSKAVITSSALPLRSLEIAPRPRPFLATRSWVAIAATVLVAVSISGVCDYFVETCPDPGLRCRASETTRIPELDEFKIVSAPEVRWTKSSPLPSPTGRLGSSRTDAPRCRTSKEFHPVGPRRFVTAPLPQATVVPDAMLEEPRMVFAAVAPPLENLFDLPDLPAYKQQPRRKFVRVILSYLASPFKALAN